MNKFPTLICSRKRGRGRSKGIATIDHQPSRWKFRHYSGRDCFDVGLHGRRRVERRQSIDWWGNGGGATVRVTETDHLPTYHEQVIICDAAGGEGYGAKFRVTVPGVENPVVTQANIELVDGGRDYAASTLITIANPSGPGAVEAKIGRVERSTCRFKTRTA